MGFLSNIFNQKKEEFSDSTPFNSEEMNQIIEGLYAINCCFAPVKWYDKVENHPMMSNPEIRRFTCFFLYPIHDEFLKIIIPDSLEQTSDFYNMSIDDWNVGKTYLPPKSIRHLLNNHVLRDRFEYFATAVGEAEKANEADIEDPLSRFNKDSDPIWKGKNAYYDLKNQIGKEANISFFDYIRTYHIERGRVLVDYTLPDLIDAMWKEKKTK